MIQLAFAPAPLVPVRRALNLDDQRKEADAVVVDDSDEEGKEPEGKNLLS